MAVETFDGTRAANMHDAESAHQLLHHDLFGAFNKGVSDEASYDADHYIGTGLRVGGLGTVAYIMGKESAYARFGNQAVNTAVIGLALTTGHFLGHDHRQDMARNDAKLDGLAEKGTYIAARFLTDAALTIGTGLAAARAGWSTEGRSSLNYWATRTSEERFVPARSKSYGPKQYHFRAHYDSRPVGVEERIDDVTQMLTARNQLNQLPKWLAKVGS